jgi:beta-N-acetylhexosaminidase
MEITTRATRSVLVAAVVPALLAAAFTPAALAEKPDHADRVRPGPPVDAREGFLRSTMARMTLEEKVGQLFFTFVSGRHAHDTSRAATNQANYGVDTPGEVVQKFHLGGVLYFSAARADNIANPTQLNAFSNSLQEVAVNEPSGIPLSLTIDQETGIVARMREPATDFSGAMALGATRDADLAERVWTIVGEELDAVGVNWNFAPVLDVNTNPLNPVIGLRSFGEDPDLVGELGTAAVEAMQATGVMATVKHFPGHGDTLEDSHFGLPLVDYDLDTLMDVHVAPFAQAIDADVDAVMTAHMIVNVFDPDMPTTLSHDFLTGLLREELAFDGLIVTDALEMGALTPFWTQAEIAVLALEAGADVLLLPLDLQEAYDGVMDAVKSGRISVKRIEESVMRILETKYDRGLFHDPFSDPALVNDVVGTPANLAVADELAHAATTLVRNQADLLPLAGTQDVLVVGTPASAELAARLGELGVDATRVEVAVTPTAAQRNAATAAAEDADLVVLTTTNARGNAAQRQLLADLAGTGKPLVTVAISLPYDVGFVPQADAVLATYSTRPVALRGVADVLVGHAEPGGRLPVTVHGPDGEVAFPYGHGLSF